MGSFVDNIDPSKIGFVNVIHELSPLARPGGDRPGFEAWSVAWSPHGSFFAWSCGKSIVKIIPWYRIKKREHISDAGPHSGRRGSSSFAKLSDTLPENCGKRRMSSVGLQDIITIDCGNCVHSLAFGCSTAKTEPHSTNLNVLRQVDDLVLATGLDNGRMRVWDVLTGGLLWELMDHRDVVSHLKFSPDGSFQLASASRDGSVKLWDMKDDGNMYKTLRMSKQKFWMYSCCWSPQATFLCCVGSPKTAVIWNLENYKIHQHLIGHNQDVVDCDYSPDGALVVTSSYDTRVIIWDPDTGDKVKVFCHMYPTPHSILAGGANGAYVRSVSFSHDSMHIATVCDDGYIRFWDYNDDHIPVKLALQDEGLCCAYSPNGFVLASGARDGSVTFYQSPMRVDQLKNLCRVAIRSIATSKKLDLLPIPIKHKEYLKYRCEL